MHRYIPLLFPIIFSIIFYQFFKSDGELSFVEKNIVTNSSFKENIFSIYGFFIITIIVCGCIYGFFNTEYNSTSINRLYSKKIIETSEEEDTVKLKPKIKKNFNYKSEAINLNNIPGSNNSIELILFNSKNNLSHKKIKFVGRLLPLILHENHKILIERKKLLYIKESLSVEKTLTNNDTVYLKKISKRYNILTRNKHKIDLIDELLLSVNIIPNSIVLAQAANESGWGTSRFAKEYNALFGQYTYDENKGVIPFQREDGKKHLIKNFTSIDKSVESYFKNINSHYAYNDFRKIRSQMNDLYNDFNIKILTETLDAYAEDESYVNRCKSFKSI